MSRRRRSGFTLIELMMVVAIMSVLLSIVVPKFGSMVIRTRESATKGALGALRSAVAIYYADAEGHFPAAGALESSLTAGGRYLKEMPGCHIPAPGDHPRATGVTDYAGVYTDVGDWMYESSVGAVSVNCTHPDSTGRLWSGW